MPHYVDAANWHCWAIGKEQANGFCVRKIVWGKLAAIYEEKREGEKIVSAGIMVREKKYRKPE